MIGEKADSIVENADEMKSGIFSAVVIIVEIADDNDDTTLPNELATDWNAELTTEGMFPIVVSISSIIPDTDEIIGEMKDEIVEGRFPIAERILEICPGICEINEETGEKRELTPAVTSPTIDDATPLMNPSISPTMLVMPLVSVKLVAMIFANSSSITTFSSFIFYLVKNNSLYYIRIYYWSSITRVASIIHWFRIS